MSADAKGLAWRTTDDYVGFGKLRFNSQCQLPTFTFKISTVCFTGIGILFETERFKSLRLETQSQSAAACEQIQNTDFPVWFRPEQ